MLGRMRGLIRNAVLILAACLTISAAGFSASRLRSGSRAVSVEHAPERTRDRPDERFLRLGTYNIAHGRGHVFGASNWDGGTVVEKKRRLGAIGALLADLGLDIVVLNEVDFSCIWSGHVDQASVIARAGGYPYIVRQRNVDVWFPFAHVDFGNAILSRHPIADADFMPFPPLSRTEKLLAGNHDSVLARVSLLGGRSIAIWAVHLEVRSREIRLEAARRIQAVAAASAEPVFVVGDFNSVYSPRQGSGDATSAISLLLDGGRLVAFPAVTALDASFTFPAGNPDRVIDWILYPPEWEVVRGGVRESRFSDHLPVAVALAQKAGPDSPSGSLGQAREAKR